MFLRFSPLPLRLIESPLDPPTSWCCLASLQVLRSYSKLGRSHRACSHTRARAQPRHLHLQRLSPWWRKPRRKLEKLGEQRSCDTLRRPIRRLQSSLDHSHPRGFQPTQLSVLNARIYSMIFLVLVFPAPAFSKCNDDGDDLRDGHANSLHPFIHPLIRSSMCTYIPPTH